MIDFILSCVHTLVIIPLFILIFFLYNYFKKNEE